MRWKEAQAETDIFTRVDLLKHAMNLYTGQVYRACADEEWLNSYVNYYAMLYVKIVNLLLKTLAGVNDYPCIQEYAGKSLKIASGNAGAYYWLITALLRSGAAKEAKQKAAAAKENLITEDYNELITRLRKEFSNLF